MLWRIALLAVLLAPLPAAAQMVCGDRDRMTGHLDEKYQESRTGMGLALGGAIIELFTAATTGTWTILYTRPGGPTCVMGSGEGWEYQEAPKPKTKGKMG